MARRRLMALKYTIEARFQEAFPPAKRAIPSYQFSTYIDTAYRIETTKNLRTTSPLCQMKGYLVDGTTLEGRSVTPCFSEKAGNCCRRCRRANHTTIFHRLLPQGIWSRSGQVKRYVTSGWRDLPGRRFVGWKECNLEVGRFSKIRDGRVRRGWSHL